MGLTLRPLNETQRESAGMDPLAWIKVSCNAGQWAETAARAWGPSFGFECHLSIVVTSLLDPQR